MFKYVHLFLVTIAIFLPSYGIGYAHGLVERVAESQQSSGRIFVADAATGDVTSVNLPEGTTIRRLSTPPYIMAMTLSADREHLFAMRGRNTERDWVTVINTGVRVGSESMDPPYVARTLLGSVPTTGGVHHGKSVTIGGKDAIFMEGTGELIVFNSDGFSSYEGLDVRRYQLAGSDHYHYIEADGYLYVGFIQLGIVQVLDLDSGAEVARIPGCPRLHGMAEDKQSGRLFFSCDPHTVVIGSKGEEARKEVGRIGYPTDQRVATFLKGKGRLFWGKKEGTLPILYRLDPSIEPYAYEILEVDSAIQQNVTDDGDYLLILTRSGVLQIRDGGTGEIVHSVTVTQPFPADFHEHTDKAILPDVLAWKDRVYVSIPNEGRIAEVDLEQGTIIRHIDVGGEPTRMVIVHSEDN